MTNPISAVSATSLELPISNRLLGGTNQSQVEGGFGELLSQGIGSVNSMQQDADSQVHQLLTGGDVSQVEVLTAVQKADMAFRLLVQVRNKLMTAYEEINAIRI